MDGREDARKHSKRDMLGENRKASEEEIMVVERFPSHISNILLNGSGLNENFWES